MFQWLMSSHIGTKFKSFNKKFRDILDHFYSFYIEQMLDSFQGYLREFFENTPVINKLKLLAIMQNTQLYKNIQCFILDILKLFIFIKSIIVWDILHFKFLGLATLSSVGEFLRCGENGKLSQAHRSTSYDTFRWCLQMTHLYDNFSLTKI